MVPTSVRSPAQHPVHPGRSAPRRLPELLRRRLHRYPAHRRHRRGRHPLRAGLLRLPAVRAGADRAADRHERRAHRRGRQPARAPARLPRRRHSHVAGAAGRDRLPHGRDRQDALLPMGRRARLPAARGLRGQALAADPRRLRALPGSPRPGQAALVGVRRLPAHARGGDHRDSVGALLRPLHGTRGVPVHRAECSRRWRPHGR